MEVGDASLRPTPALSKRLKRWLLGSPIPPDLLPTPNDQRRRRSTKSARMDTSSPSEDAPTPQPPLTALQRLSLARKGSSSSTPTVSGSSTPQIGQDNTTTAPPPKPMSKLAALAQKRKEEAAARAASTNITPSSSATPPDAASKPLSKLAQKMAAAQSVRQASSIPGTAVLGCDSSDGLDIDLASLAIDEETAQLFSAPTLPDGDPNSAFYDILTTSTKVITPETTMSLHLPFDDPHTEERVRAAFGPDVESPDDIVLRARSGRAGTADKATGASRTGKG